MNGNFMFEFKKGMICLMEATLYKKDEDTGEKEILVKEGTPVKIADIVDPDCPARVSGECQAPCKDTYYCPRTIIVEDCGGKHFDVDYDTEDEEYPLVALEGDKIEDLLQKKGWKQFKMADWMANIAQRYADLLEQWENESYEEECGCDWLEEVGEAVKFYAMECAARNKTPTFKGLIEHIRKKR